ncbi:MAG: hypothetical protein ACOC46_01760 [Pirellulales bacterium]
MNAVHRNLIGRHGRRRRAMAAIVVLLLISVTLGLSYAAVRSELFVSRIQQNARRRHHARHAAVTGLTMALKKMHTEAWEGVDTTLTGELNKFERFEVSYTTGDPSLAKGDDDWADLPYRVTLRSTGYAANPADPGSVATYRVRAVVRLIPRALGRRPDDWENIRRFTLYQWRRGAVRINVPCRIPGMVRSQEAVEYGELGQDYWWPEWVRDRYFQDLETLRQGGGPDWRPFDGPLHLSFEEQENFREGSVEFLRDRMGIPLVDQPTAEAAIEPPGSMTSYRIYPGGKDYEVELLPNRLEDARYRPDPETNPLGFFYRTGSSTEVHDNVRIEGTLFAQDSWKGDVHVRGENVELRPFDLPPLDGSDTPVRLPTLALEDDLQIYSGASGRVTGLVFAGGDIEVKQADQAAIDVTLKGHFLVKDLKLSGRQEWADKSWTWWNDRYNAFMNQLGSQDGVADFVTYLANTTQLDPTPRIVFQPEETAADYHWQDFTRPIYVPAEDDEGLRWDLIEWAGAENP